MTSATKSERPYTQGATVLQKSPLCSKDTAIHQRRVILLVCVQMLVSDRAYAVAAPAVSVSRCVKVSTTLSRVTNFRAVPRRPLSDRF
jgi:hypothetical protein